MTYEISHICHRAKLQCGFCEGWFVSDGLLVLDRPFVRFLLHSKKGPVLCRGAWTLGDWLPEGDYEIRPISREPWMELEITDVIIAMDLCVECAIELPKKGFCRLTIL